LPPIELIEAELSRRQRNKIARYFPDEGKYARALYPKQLAFFEAGAKYRERCFMAGNRVGKSDAGAYELTLHLTGRYPGWWRGKRFTRPVRVWAAGDTSKTVREIVQEKLLGPPGAHGTGMIPGDAILKTTTKSGVADAIDTVWVRHAAGGHSMLVLKSYDQRRESFQGTEQDVIWLDEEPDQGIYTECLLRTMTSNGIVLLTFTPLLGLSDVVLSFLPGGDLDRAAATGKFLVTCTWDEVPHLTPEARDELWLAIPPHQRECRSKGVPVMGAGAIYPVPEEDIVVADFELPKHWPRCYGLDVGWNRTAAVWGALDRDTDVLYLYSEYYRGDAEPSVHAHAIRARGEWIPGVIDPAARGRSQVDGRQLVQMYRDLGLDLAEAQNAVEAGIYEVWQRMSSGRLKVFRSLSNYLEERRLYRRDEKGKIVKEKDHLQDGVRYLVMSGIERAVTMPAPKQEIKFTPSWGGGGSWMT